MEKSCLNYNMKCDGGTVSLEGNSRMDAHPLPTSKPQRNTQTNLAIERPPRQRIFSLI